MRDRKPEEKTKMRVDLNRRELHLLKLWWLSCEDMMIPEGSCGICEFKDECMVIRRKLYGMNGGERSKYPNGNVYMPEAEEQQVLPQPA